MKGALGFLKSPVTGEVDPDDILSVELADAEGTEEGGGHDLAPNARRSFSTRTRAAFLAGRHSGHRWFPFSNSQVRLGPLSWSAGSSSEVPHQSHAIIVVITWVLSCGAP